MGDCISKGWRIHSSTALPLNEPTILSNVQLNSSTNTELCLNNRRIQCYAVSRKGYNKATTKINQDRCLCYYDEKTYSLIVGIFDGHGEKGHVIAETIRDLFIHNLINNPLFEDDPLGSMHSAIREAEETIFTNDRELCEMNGTTADIAVIRCSKVYAMNIGDSRMFYAYQNEEKKTQTESITTIHCPDHENERRRIENCGGRVSSLRAINSHVSTSRVHPAGDDIYSGLAMSRSLCDAYFHRCGVISEPDLYEKELSDNSIGLLVGSDGLTTIFGMDTCFKCILENENPGIGLNNLSKNCYDSMYKCSNKQYVDDISGVFVYFCPK